MTTRSKPIPAPPCGYAPYLNDSKYDLMFDSAIRLSIQGSQYKTDADRTEKSVSHCTQLVGGGQKAERGDYVRILHSAARRLSISTS